MANRTTSKLLTEADLKDCQLLISTGRPPVEEEGHAMGMKIYDKDGTYLSLPCSIYQRSDNLEIILAVNCNDFIREKGLAVNDKIILSDETMQDQAPRTYRVRIDVERYAFRLFGVDIWLNL
uniref:Uncharacterized protein n=1 Tax=Manihot esculenta TaxID=3983 RepID=A0A2C9V5G9_MANES